MGLIEISTSRTQDLLNEAQFTDTNPAEAINATCIECDLCPTTRQVENGDRITVSGQLAGLNINNDPATMCPLLVIFNAQVIEEPTPKDIAKVILIKGLRRKVQGPHDSRDRGH